MIKKIPGVLCRTRRVKKRIQCKPLYHKPLNESTKTNILFGTAFLLRPNCYAHAQNRPATPALRRDWCGLLLTMDVLRLRLSAASVEGITW